MSKRYKLLKDLPGYKAGEIVEKVTAEGVSFITGGNFYQAVDRKSFALACGMVENNPDWFEELPPEPTRWRAENNGKYYYVTNMGEADYFWDNDDFDNQHYEFGNYFKSKETAEKVAEAVKALYAIVHDNVTNKDADISGSQEDQMIALLNAARRALQSDNQLHKEG